MTKENQQLKVGVCPSCGESAVIFVQPDEAHLGLLGRAFDNEDSLNIVKYCCASCHTVLGVESNPIAMRDDIMNAVKKLAKPESG